CRALASPARRARRRDPPHEPGSRLPRARQRHPVAHPRWHLAAARGAQRRPAPRRADPPGRGLSARSGLKRRGRWGAPALGTSSARLARVTVLKLITRTLFTSAVTSVTTTAALCLLSSKDTGRP